VNQRIGIRGLQRRYRGKVERGAIIEIRVRIEKR
jgi:hypothetical protein